MLDFSDCARNGIAILTSAAEWSGDGFGEIDVVQERPRTDFRPPKLPKVSSGRPHSSTNMS